VIPVRRPTVLLLLLALLAGCGTPGGDSSDNAEKAKEAERSSRKIDVSKAGDVTLTVWDQEVRGGQRRQIEQLNDAFHARYPNVTIKRVAKSFTDLNTTLKLAVSGDKAPDVVQANQGRPTMGALVKGGLLRPLDAYAAAYGWADRYPPVLLDLNRFSVDGRTFGAGKLFGVSQMGEIVGVYYNRDKVSKPPATFEAFEQALAAAKARGEVPISFGNLDKWPGIHEFQSVQNAYASPAQVRDFVFAREGASFDTPENRDAAGKLAEWAKAGYFTKNFNGVGYDPAWQQFSKGAGPFLIAGTWLLRDLSDAMGDRLGFMLVPPRAEGDPARSLGGESLPFAITEKSGNPDVAAAYIDFLTDANAARVLVETGNLPAMPTNVKPSNAAGEQVFEAWRTLGDGDGLVPYLDYATPSFYDDITAGVQRLLAGRQPPDEFVQSLQGDFEKFTGSS
jgi:raffinose/stachyose/melibiose transport system substrate-binding protein